MKNKKIAFSLIELSIVILVIGIIVAAVVTSNSIVTKANTTAAQKATNDSPIRYTSGLLSWYDATAAGVFNTTTDGATLTQWNDSSPSALNATTVGTVKYSAAGINGLPAVSVPGSGAGGASGSFVVSSYPTTFPSPEATVFVVFTIDQNGMAGSGYIIGKNATHDFSIQGSGAIRAYANSIGAISSTIIGSPYIVSVAIGLTAETYRNGALAATATPNTSTAPSATQLYIGSTDPGLWGPTARIGEVIIFSRKLTDTERKEIESYLGKKWKITVS